jgi:hypothetical protein
VEARTSDSDTDRSDAEWEEDDKDDEEEDDEQDEIVEDTPPSTPVLKKGRYLNPFLQAELENLLV